MQQSNAASNGSGPPAQGAAPARSESSATRPASGTCWCHAPAAAPAEPGTVLGGKYRLLRKLARGSMGTVWAAEHLTLRSPVAVKLMHAGADSETLASSTWRADVFRRFLSEARITASVRSPHVVQILDCGVQEETPYLVMELLQGETLAARVHRSGPLAPVQTALLLAQLALALRRVHELKIIHRDLKPENIFLVRGEEGDVLKLLDFGVARTRNQRLLGSLGPGTLEGDLVGTPNYMSPEQLQGSSSLDHRTDVWALGVIAFECLLGHPPFIASNLAGVILAICSQPIPVPSQLGAVPVGFDAWFARACARDPSERFVSAKQASSELQRVCQQPRSAPLPWLAATPRRRLGLLVAIRRWVGLTNALPEHRDCGYLPSHPSSL